MMKRVLVQVDEATHVAWKLRAFSEGRSMSDLARQLIEAAVLTERGGNSPERRRVEDVGSTPTTAPPRSVSADVAATIPVVRPHMKKGRPAVECPTRIGSGVCPDCGREV